MILLTVSDVHENTDVLRWLPQLAKDVDVVVVAGDVALWAKTEFYTQFYQTLSKSAKQILYVPGNHDPQITLNLPNLTNLHAQEYELMGLKFAGMGGSNPTPFNTPLEYSDEEAEEMLSRLTGSIDIFVSHTPPYNTNCDRADSDRHIGSIPIRRFVERVKPRLVLCGHAHESRAIDRVGEAIVVNGGAAKYSYYTKIHYSHGEFQVELLEAR